MSGNPLEGVQSAIYFKSGAPPVARPRLSPGDERLVLEARAHWARMRDDPEGCEDRPNTADCTLCQEYVIHGCLLCPVVSVTGEGNCRETPLARASDAYYNIERTAPYTNARRLAVLEFQEAAQRVIDWINKNLLAESRELKCIIVPEPEELRRIVLESVERNKESTKRIVDVVCGHLPESCRRIADDQQLPSEITRAAEREEDDS